MNNNWADRVIAQPQGYARAVLFPRARDALRCFIGITGYKLQLPICVCPEIASCASKFLDVDECGMAPGTQLYGFRKEHANELDLDPLMTGWWTWATTLHRIVSFGPNKILPLTGGGAFLTNDMDLAKVMEGHSFFPGGQFYPIKVARVLSRVDAVVYRRRAIIKMWDRYLGDMLARIPHEQVMPWALMRLAPPDRRAALIGALRAGAIAVSTNYPAIRTEAQHYPGGMLWEASVISFPIHEASDDNIERYIYRAAQIIYGVLNQ